jgi:hypothetical protein
MSRATELGRSTGKQSGLVRWMDAEDISCAITHFGASVQSNYPDHPIQIQRFHMERVKSKIGTMF